MDNSVLPFQLDRASVRGRIVRLGSVLDDILGPHDYPQALAAQVGEASLLAVLVASLLKYDGIFTLQAQGEGGPVSMLVADTTSIGELRACANIREGAVLPHDGTVGDFIGKGYIAFTVDQGAHTERYQGIVELKPEGLRQSLVHYFTQSEQIQTGIILSLKRFEGGWRGGALIVQEIPREGGQGAAAGSDEEDDWRRVMMLMQSCTGEELLDPALSAQDLLYRLFHEETVRVFDALTIYKSCRCSEEKLLSLLTTMPADDLDYMEQEEGGIAMRCEFCGTAYRFTREEIDDHAKKPD